MGLVHQSPEMIQGLQHCTHKALKLGPRHGAVTWRQFPGGGPLKALSSQLPSGLQKEALWASASEAGREFSRAGLLGGHQFRLPG